MSAVADGAGAPKKGSLGKSVVEFLLVTAIGAAAAAAFFYWPPGGAPPAADKAAAAAGAPAGADLIDLPPIVTNLGAPTDTWVRLEASLVFEAKAAPHPDVLGAEIASDFLGYLRTATLAELEGPVGLQNLRHDLGERASIRSGGKVTAVILRTLVVQ